jgi:hypothetical protein
MDMIQEIRILYTPIWGWGMHWIQDGRNHYVELEFDMTEGQALLMAMAHFRHAISKEQITIERL